MMDTTIGQIGAAREGVQSALHKLIRIMYSKPGSDPALWNGGQTSNKIVKSVGLAPSETRERGGGARGRRPPSIFY